MHCKNMLYPQVQCRWFHRLRTVAAEVFLEPPADSYHTHRKAPSVVGLSGEPAHELLLVSLARQAPSNRHSHPQLELQSPLAPMALSVQRMACLRSARALRPPLRQLPAMSRIVYSFGPYLPFKIPQDSAGCSRWQHEPIGPSQYTDSGFISALRGLH